MRKGAIENKLGDFKIAGMVFFKNKSAAREDFEKMLKEKGWGYTIEHRDGGMWYVSSTKLSDHVEKEVAPGVKQINVNSLLNSICRR